MTANEVREIVRKTLEMQGVAERLNGTHNEQADRSLLEAARAISPYLSEEGDEDQATRVGVLLWVLLECNKLLTGSHYDQASRRPGGSLGKRFSNKEAFGAMLDQTPDEILFEAALAAMEESTPLAAGLPDALRSLESMLNPLAENGPAAWKFGELRDILLCHPSRRHIEGEREGSGGTLALEYARRGGNLGLAGACGLREWHLAELSDAEAQSILQDCLTCARQSPGDQRADMLFHTVVKCRLLEGPLTLDDAANLF